MLIGLLSDTHDHLDAMVAAMRVLRAAGAEYFLHGGDVGGDGILDVLAGDKAAFVFGNNDWDRRELARHANSIGVQCLDDFGELTLAGKTFAITHGDDMARLKRIHRDQRHDYLITGHTHVKRDERIGKIRWINPGALYRAREKTVAVLDPEKDTLKFLTVEV
jgi:putative phosphoesterase